MRRCSIGPSASALEIRSESIGHAPVGAEFELTAHATIGESVLDVTEAAQWRSSDEAVATVDSGGYVIAGWRWSIDHHRLI